MYSFYEIYVAHVIWLTPKVVLFYFVFMLTLFSLHCFFLGNLINFHNFSHHLDIHDFLVPPQLTHIPYK